MTNGDCWKTESKLRTTLQKIQEAGYDGKIGLSYDNFHGQSFDRIKTFASAVNEIFGEESLNIQAILCFLQPVLVQWQKLNGCLRNFFRRQG